MSYASVGVFVMIFCMYMYLCVHVRMYVYVYIDKSSIHLLKIKNVWKNFKMLHNLLESIELRSLNNSI